MSPNDIVVWCGFILAAYSVVGNDVIQTLGTFLSSNEKSISWYILFLYAGGILTAILIIGYTGLGTTFGLGGDDISFGRLENIQRPELLNWFYLLPPLVLMLITRLGIPVSTTFLILTFFSPSSLDDMIQKSVMGYVVAFIFSMIAYYMITNFAEKKFINSSVYSTNNKDSLWTNRTFWTVIQWFSTGFLWSQWLTQDLANIYIYLGKDKLSTVQFLVSLFIILVMLGYIFYAKGGKIQEIVKRKYNTADIRSATFIDLFYGLILLIFKQNVFGLWVAKLPMSTTWVFIGLLAGREIMMAWKLDGILEKKEIYAVIQDLVKVIAGLIISILLVYIMKFFTAGI